MVNDDHVNAACDLLDRIRQIQYQRVNKEPMPEEIAQHRQQAQHTSPGGLCWHSSEDVLNAMLVLDVYSTKALLREHIASAEAFRREMSGRKLDG